MGRGKGEPQGTCEIMRPMVSVLLLLLAVQSSCGHFRMYTAPEEEVEEEYEAISRVQDRYRRSINAPKSKNKRVKKERLYRLEGPDGPKSIKTYEEAVDICEKDGGTISEPWRLRDAVKLQGLERCQGCGWMKKSGDFYKNFRPPCGQSEETEDDGYYRCADSPSDEGLSGYDAYCYGTSGPVLPPDAVAINVGSDRGYVFAVKAFEDAVISAKAEASVVCKKRGATLASSQQVSMAWQNGFSICACGWMENYSGMPMREKLSTCKNRMGFVGCHTEEMKHAFCFANEQHDPRGVNLMDFDQLGKDMFPGGIEKGAVQIYGGYVYPAMNEKGHNRAMTIFEAYHTCYNLGASVATPEQLTHAWEAGMESCDCSWTWENAQLLFNVLVRGKGAVYKVSQGGCGDSGLVSCPHKNPRKGMGWNVYCHKECPPKCPPPLRWNLPPNPIRVHGGRVFHWDSDEKYQFASLEEAQKACSAHHAEVATMEQLENAQSNGLTKCRCGYLADGSVAFPIYRRIQGCGDEVGIHQCPGGYSNIREKGPKWDTYCFIADETIQTVSTFDTAKLGPTVEQEEEQEPDESAPPPPSHARPGLAAGAPVRHRQEGLSLLQKYKQQKAEEERKRKEEEAKARKAEQQKQMMEAIRRRMEERQRLEKEKELERLKNIAAREEERRQKEEERKRIQREKEQQRLREEEEKRLRQAALQAEREAAEEAKRQRQEERERDRVRLEEEKRKKQAALQAEREQAEEAARRRKEEKEAERLRQEEEKRLKQEQIAAEKARQEEERKRKREEKERERLRQEQEKRERQKALEAERMAKEEAAAQRKAEKLREEAEKKRQREQERLELEAQQKEQRKKKREEEERRHKELRQKEKEAEQERLAEEKRKKKEALEAEKRRKAEERRKKKEAEKKRKAEAKRLRQAALKAERERKAEAKRLRKLEKAGAESGGPPPHGLTRNQKQQHFQQSLMRP